MEQSPINAILDLARWAPSADNSQPWRFEVLGAEEAKIHGYVPSDLSEYDYNGAYSHFAFGCLLRTLELAATKFGYEALITRHPESNPQHPLFTLRLKKNPQKPEPLSEQIKTRVSNRFPYQTTGLSQAQKEALAASCSPDLVLTWLEGFKEKEAFARINRLFAAFAKPDRAGIIEWGVQDSKEHIPESAIGVTEPNLSLARFFNSSKKRLRFADHFLGFKIISPLLGFYLPALFSGAHVVMQYKKAPDDYLDYTNIGKAFQSFWLTATSLGLSLQMETGPVAFYNQVKAGHKFSDDPSQWKQAQKMADKLENLLGAKKLENAVMISRLGYAAPPAGRSTRLSLEELRYDPKIDNDTIWKKIP